MDNLRQEYAQLHHEIERHAFWDVRSSWQAMRTSLIVLEDMYQDISVGLVETLTDPVQALEVVSSNNRDKLNHFFLLAYKLIYSYSAMRSTLWGLTCDCLKTYRRTHIPFWEDSHKRFVQFGKEPSVVFVWKLRHYLIHEATAPSTVQSHFTQNSFAVWLQLDREALLKSKEFGPFIRDNTPEGEPIDIISTIQDCQEKIRSFYGWLMPKFSEVHSEQIASFEQLRQRAVELETIFYSGDPPTQVPEV